MAGQFLPFRPRPETSPLGRAVLGAYRSQVPATPEPFVLHVIPHGFVDLLWGPAGRLRVAGPDSRYRTVALAPGEIVGIRFRMGMAGCLLGVPVSELADARVPLSDLWGTPAEALAERVAAAATGAGAMAVLRAALAERLAGAGPPDHLVRAALVTLQRSPAAKVAEVSDDLGVSERQLRRRFRAAVGHGPKTAQRIFRLHRFLRSASALGDRGGIADLAVAAGYVDQAHLTNDCVELTGFTPAAMVNARARVSPAGVPVSVSSNTAPAGRP